MEPTQSIEQEQDQAEGETSGRQVGGESLVNRVFREVALTILGKAGLLNEAKDQFVSVMASHKSAKRTDRVYAQKYADDMATRLAMSMPVVKNAVIAPPKAPELDQAVLDELFGAVADNSGSVEDLIDLVQKPGGPLQSLVSKDGPMGRVLDEFLSAGSKEHPFVRVVSHQGQRYVGLGTIMGTVLNGKHAGEKINAHMTVVPHRRFRDVPEDIAPLLNGRQVSLEGDVPGSTPDRQLRKFLFVIRHRPGLKVRWWVRLGDKDQPGGVRRIVLTDDAVGFRQDTSPTA